MPLWLPAKAAEVGKVITIDVWPTRRKAYIRDVIVTAKPPKKLVPTGTRPAITSRIVHARSPKQIDAEKKYNSLKGASAANHFKDEGCDCDERIARALEKSSDISEMEFFGAGQD